MPEPADGLLPKEGPQKCINRSGSTTTLDAASRLLPTTPCAAPMSSRRICKNLAVLAFTQYLFYQGFVALTDLQSTMNSEQGIGTDSQAAMYATSMVASLLLAELLIKSIGCKWCYALTMACSVPYIVANYSPTWATLIPASILRGLADGPLATALSTYTHDMARRFARGGDFGSVASIFFGISPFSQSNAQIWGNLISYYALRPAFVPVQNSTGPSQNCGASFIKSLNGTDQFPISDEQRNVLVTVFAACGVLSVVTIALFLDSLGNDVDREQCKGQFVLRRLTAAVEQGLKCDQLLLVPISVYCGLESAFYASEFTQAYIACSWGVYHVGFVTICYGACGGLMSILVGPLVRITSQNSVIILGAIISATTFGLLFGWQPRPDTPVLFFVFAGLFGVIDAIWWSQIPALHGTLFSDNREAAFAIWSFWSYVGKFLNYSYSYSLVVPVKITILMVFLVSGTVLCVAGRVKINCAGRKGYSAIEEK